METILSLHDVCKAYSDFSLKNISFDLPRGMIMGLVGENGAGKTTTIKSILGGVHIDSGTIAVGGQNITESETYKEDIGVVFDETHFPSMLSAKEVGNILKGIYSNFSMDAYQSYLHRLNLSVDKTIKDYSRGMKMKLSLAAALSHDAQLLILDEPTSGLDPLARREVLDLLMEYMEDGERGILFSSHITGDLERISDYITFIHRGRMLFCERKDTLLEEMAVLRGSKSDADQIDSRDVMGRSENAFGVAILVRDGKSMQRKYPMFSVDRVTIEDIMIMMTEGEK